MDIEALGDEVLMRRVCARDVDAFRVLYCRYESRVFNFVYRFVGERALAEDLLQETFWRIWQGAHTYDSMRGGFRSWLYRVALNATRSEMGLKRHSREIREGEMAGQTLSATGQGSPDDPEVRFERSETAALVASALAGLSPALREVVALRCVEGMKFSEIAAVTGAPPGTLKTRFHRAVTELRRRLAPGEQ